ncbi:hypothetical protein DM02DRAFT_590687 [Periconia macrospinosa]|uniref:Uncharacterized protein n=1 Tax=Periconia macrospinosa TaxID=97972 RepID=A0A2V1DU54_9PLEO|nr:hypothetical protein DM02DRAFT_590687 [Periconia macrospinosa]
MNYAEMIQEKNLKKTFIIATLCSTLVGTFTSSIGLWDRVKDKRRQGKRDHKQEQAIKELQERADKAEKERDERRRQGGPPQRRRNGDYGDSYYLEDDEVGDSFERSGALIQRQFDEGYGRLGKRFAIGDTVTENRLQRHIIALQQTVIQVLQDALANDRQLSRADMAKLVAASDAARLGSVEALREQQHRLAIEYDHDALPHSSSSSPSRYTAAAALEDSSPEHAGALIPVPQKRSSTVIIQDDPHTNGLFCPYSTHLQTHPQTPLPSSFTSTSSPPPSSLTCPTCTTLLPISADDIWTIGKKAALASSTSPSSSSSEKIVETRAFRLGPRFVVKCHTRQGEFACALCARFRERDVVCRTVDALVNHVGRFHRVWELEQDVDLREGVVVVGARDARDARRGSVVSVWERERR